MDLVIVDTNLLLLLITGAAHPRYIALHKNLSSYRVSDFEILGQAISLFSEIVLLPHILAEVSNLARQGIRGPLEEKSSKS